MIQLLLLVQTNKINILFYFQRLHCTFTNLMNIQLLTMTKTKKSTTIWFLSSVRNQILILIWKSTDMIDPLIPDSYQHIILLLYYNFWLVKLLSRCIRFEYTPCANTRESWCNVWKLQIIISCIFLYVVMFNMIIYNQNLKLVSQCCHNIKHIIS